jgi:hypothetical protein
MLGGVSVLRTFPRIFSVMPEQSQKNNDWKWHAQQPEKRSFTKTHFQPPSLWHGKS